MADTLDEGIVLLQDQTKHKESQWNKEKEELNKNLKHQEHLLQKLTADKNQFETRMEAIQDQKFSTEEQLCSTIDSLEGELRETKGILEKTTTHRDEALEKCAEFEGYIARMGLECKETMNKVSCSIEWGKAIRKGTNPEADNYIQDIARDLRIRELEDKIRQLERERIMHFEEKKVLQFNFDSYNSNDNVGS